MFDLMEEARRVLMETASTDARHRIAIIISIEADMSGQTLTFPISEYKTLNKQS